MANNLGQTMIDQIKAQAPKTNTPPAPAKSDSSTWSVNTDKQTPPQGVVNASDIATPVDNSVIEQSQKQGTFVTYNPTTGTGANRRPLEIGQQGANDYLETPINGADYAQNPDAYVVTNKDAKTLYGFKKPVAKAETGQLGTPEAPGATPEANSYSDEIANMYSELRGLITGNMATEADVNARQEEASDARIAAEEARQAINDNNLRLFGEKQNIEDRVIPMSEIRKQVAQLDKDEQLNSYMLTQDYNDKQIMRALAEGNLMEAQRINQQVASDRYNLATLQLDELKTQNAIEEADYNRRMQQAQYDLDLQNTYGYTPIFGGQAGYEEAVTQFGASRLWQDPVSKDWYVKPDLDKQIKSTIQVDGHLWGLNANGDKVKDYGRTTNYDFSVQDDGSVLVTDPSTGEVITTETPEATTLSIGSGTITGMNGSNKWQWGLDFVLAGGKGAEVKTPYMGEVIFAGENGGFGNQVKIDVGDGTEIWFSHLDSIDVKKGDYLSDQQIIGTQGNTGDVYSLTGGDGTHLDITMKKPDGTFYKAPEVANLLGYQSQSGDLKSYEDAFNVANAKLPGTQQKNNQNLYNKYAKAGDTEQLTQLILGTAYDAMGQQAKDAVDTRESVMDELSIVSNGLQTLEDKGIDPGWILGKEEDIMKAIGKTVDPDVKYMQTRIMKAVIAFRKAATGVQFNVIEQAQYEAMFPGIDKDIDVSQAAIAGLRDAMISEQEQKYKAQMGEANFDRLFGDRYQSSNFMAGGNALSVTTPDGQTFTFPDEESLNQFKEAAGL